MQTKVEWAKNKKMRNSKLIIRVYVWPKIASLTFNKQAKQLHSLSSGYYPEWCNAWFEELILSEYVWMVRPKYSTPATNEIVPVTIKTSNLLHKTSVNDRLIEYTMEFEESFDYINNVR